VQNYPNHAIGKFRLSVTNAKIQPRPFPNLSPRFWISPPKENEAGAEQLLDYFVKQGPATQRIREQIASLRNQLNQIKPSATVPMMKEVVDANRRESPMSILRGSLPKQGANCSCWVSLCLSSQAQRIDKPHRLGFAKWLMQDDNP
jgi:hypothetical protein